MSSKDITLCLDNFQELSNDYIYTSGGLHSPKELENIFEYKQKELAEGIARELVKSGIITFQTELLSCEQYGRGAYHINARMMVLKGGADLIRKAFSDWAEEKLRDINPNKCTHGALWDDCSDCRH